MLLSVPLFLLPSSGGREYSQPAGRSVTERQVGQERRLQVNAAQRLRNEMRVRVAFTCIRVCVCACELLPSNIHRAWVFYPRKKRSDPLRQDVHSYQRSRGNRKFLREGSEVRIQRRIGKKGELFVCSRERANYERTSKVPYTALSRAESLKSSRSGV